MRSINWFLRALLDDHTEFSDEELQIIVAELGMSYLTEGCLCAVIHPTDRPEDPSHIMNWLHSLDSLMRKARSMQIVHDAIIDHYMNVCLICAPDRKQALLCISRLAEKNGITAGIGACCDGLRSASLSVAQAYEALNCCSDAFPVVEYDDIKGNVNNRLFQMESETILNEFRNQWSEQSLTHLRELAEQIRARTYRQPDAPYPTTIRRTMEALLSQMMLITADAGLTPEDVLQDAHPYETLWQQGTTETLTECLYHMAEAMDQAIRGKLRSRNKKKISQIKDLISLRLSDPQLCLDMISNEIGINPKYLSHLFAERTGEGFSAYLRRARIEKAKQLLTETDDPTALIATACGFRTSSYFIEVFRHVEGVTPTQYRKQK